MKQLDATSFALIYQNYQHSESVYTDDSESTTSDMSYKTNNIICIPATSKISGLSTLVGTVLFEDIFEGSIMDAVKYQELRLKPAISSTRNWKYQARKLIYHSDIIIYDPTSLVHPNVISSLAELINQFQKQYLATTSKWQKRVQTFILSASIQAIKKLNPSLVVSSIPSSIFDLEMKYMIKMTELTKVDNICFGNVLDFKTNCSSTEFDIFVECFHAGMLFNGNSLSVPYLKTINLEHMSPQGDVHSDVTKITMNNQNMLLRLSNSESAVYWAISTAFMMNNTDKRILVYCQNGITCSYILLFAFILIREIKNGRDNSYGAIILKCLEVRPFKVFNQKLLLLVHSIILDEIPCLVNTDTLDLEAVPSVITETILLGSERDALNINLLSKMGVTHILNVGAEHSAVSSKHFRFHRISNLEDNGRETISQYFNQAFEFINNAKAINGRVLIHCKAGVSRSATIVIAYLMKYNNLSAFDSFLFVRTRRLEVVVQPNEQFMFELLEFERFLNGIRSKCFMDLCLFVHEINLKFKNLQLIT